MGILESLASMSASSNLSIILPHPAPFEEGGPLKSFFTAHGVLP